ncbi:unnamed protein product [Rangifer tarandus platyrhynchus]
MLRRRPGPEPPSDPAAPAAGRRARSPSLCPAVLPAVGTVGTRFFFSKTEACSLPAPLEMEVNSTDSPSTQGPSACGAALPLAASPAGLEGLPGCPPPLLTLLPAASLFLLRSGQSRPPAQSRDSGTPAQALPESTACPEEASQR